MSELYHDTVMHKIEDEMDLSVLKEVKEHALSSGEVGISLDKMEKLLNE